MKRITLLLLAIIAFETKAQFIEASKDSLITAVPLKFKNIGEGAGKVLTSDALGRATWQIPASGAGLWSVNGLGGNEIQNTNAGGFWSSYATIVPYSATNTSNPPTAPVAGAGTRMMWIPSRSAFRSGTVNADAWDASNIGLHSFASGYNSRATGVGNVAIGTNAISDGTSNTIAIGENTHASGLNGTAIGTGTTANAYYSVAIGYYNSPIATANASTWVSTDPLLYVGNGQSAASPSNAMVIQKNGVVNIGITPNNSTTYKLRVSGSISATSTIQASNLRSTSLGGSGVRQVCTDDSGNLIECSSGSGNLSYYNVSAMGFHAVVANHLPSYTFVKDVAKCMISFVNDTKSTNGYAYAPVELPNGAVMDKMTFNYLQNSGGAMILKFYSVEKQTNAASALEATVSSTPVSGMGESTTTFSKNLVIDNSKFYYYLRLDAGVNWQGSDMALRGVIFSYTK